MSEQMTIWDLTMPMICIDKPIRLIELFAGYGSQAMALKRLGVAFEHHRVIEIDKFAVNSYNAIHGTNFSPIDINNLSGGGMGIINKDKYCYVLTYSFPCTDLSVAGRMQGMSEDSNTRSSLLWQVRRLLYECKEYNDNLPDVLLMENVPQVVGYRNIKDFHKWQDVLSELGYTNYVQILNAKDFGIPQNRERAFMVSVLGKYNYHFPERIKLNKVMKDILEDDVAEKYYINSEKAQSLIDELIENGTIPNSESGGGRPVLTELSTSRERKRLQTVLKQDAIMGFQTCKQTETWSLNTKKVDKQIDIAHAILANNHKGLGGGEIMNNGVIECQKQE